MFLDLASYWQLMLIFWETVILEGKKSERQRKKKRKNEIRGSEVEMWISGQYLRTGRGQRAVNQGFLTSLSLKGRRPLSPFAAGIWTAGPVPSDPRRFVSKTKIYWLWFLIKSISNVGPIDTCMFKERLIWPSQNSWAQHLFLSIACDLDQKLRRWAQLVTCVVINKNFLQSCSIGHSKIPDNPLGEKFFPKF